MNLVNKILIEGIDTMQMLLTLGQKFQKISPHQDNINKEDFQDCIMRCELFMKWINSKDFKIIVGEPIEDSEMDTMQLNLQKNKKFKKMFKFYISLLYLLFIILKVFMFILDK